MKRSRKIVLIVTAVLLLTGFGIAWRINENGQRMKYEGRTVRILFDNPSKEPLLVQLNDDEISVPPNSFVLFPVSKKALEENKFHLRSVHSKTKQPICDTSFSVDGALSDFFINPSRSCYYCWRMEYEKIMTHLQPGTQQPYEDRIHLSTKHFHDNPAVITQALVISFKDGYNPLRRKIDETLPTDNRRDEVFFYTFVLRETDYHLSYDYLLRRSPFSKKRDELKALLNDYCTRLEKNSHPRAMTLRSAISVGPYSVKGFEEAVAIARRMEPDAPYLPAINTALDSLRANEENVAPPVEVKVSSAALIVWRETWTGSLFPETILSKTEQPFTRFGE